MSLETAIQENTAAINKLIAFWESMSASTPAATTVMNPTGQQEADVTPQKETRKGPFYYRADDGDVGTCDALADIQGKEISKVEYLQAQDEAKKAADAADAAPKPLTLADLDTAGLVTLAVLHGANDSTPEQIAEAQHAATTTNGDERNTDADALYMALVGAPGEEGVPSFTALTKEAQLKMAAQIYHYWGELTTIDLRRDFASKLLKVSGAEREKVKPTKPKAKAKKAEAPQPEEKASSESEDLRAKAKAMILELSKQGKQSDVRSTLNLFGAAKLSEAPDDRLQDLIDALDLTLNADDDNLAD